MPVQGLHGLDCEEGEGGACRMDSHYHSAEGVLRENASLCGLTLEELGEDLGVTLEWELGVGTTTANRGVLGEQEARNTALKVDNDLLDCVGPLVHR